MTIRSRLLALLLPTLILFVFLISIFFFYNWNTEITDSFKANLRSIVTTIAEMIDGDEIEKINKERNDPTLLNSEIYKKNEALLYNLRDKLPVKVLYIVTIDPVKKGDPVLQDRPVSDLNPLYDGINPENGHRQVYLLDTSSPHTSILKQDFSESDEHLIYFTKKPLVTPIYEGKGSHEEFMTGYAPILNKKGDVVALVGADVNLSLVNRITRHARLVILGTTLLTILLVTLSVIFIANKITKPILQLKNAALALAAGEYEEKIAIKGPKEIAELSNTFNTMRECLLDYINRLKKSSFAKEKLQGEENSALLMQNRMLEGVIERQAEKRLLFKHISPTQPVMTKALLLTLNESEPMTEFVLSESKEEGLEGVYSLLKGGTSISGKISGKVNFSKNTLQIENDNMPPPFIWKTQENKFLNEEDKIASFIPGDLILLFNQEMTVLFPHRQIVKDWLGKVLRQFAKEPEGLLTAMLTSELNFWIKKQLNPRNIHILLVRRDSTSSSST